MDDKEERELHEKLALLRTEHRDLDERIRTLEESAPFDQFSIMRMKKRKLMVKDQLATLEDKLFPDIIA
ncbi:MAG: DUF465 domain-containing protein [Pseudomonadota bacterium]